eukprot:1862545-Pyramimonas_sp.AAC.1
MGWWGFLFASAQGRQAPSRNAAKKQRPKIRGAGGERQQADREARRGRSEKRTHKSELRCCSGDV